MFTRAFDRITLVGALPTAPEIMANLKSPTVKFNCEFCAQSPGYLSDTEVAVHKQHQHKKQIARLFEKNNNVCRMCIKRTSSRGALLKHFKTSHLLCNGEETRIQRDVYICGVCHRLFFSKLMLTYHLSSIHKFKSTGISCPKCGKHMKFSSAYIHFEGHMLCSVCTCQICFLKFDCKRMLQRHVRSFHSYSFKCNMCSFESNKHSNLRLHTEKAHGAKSSESVDLGVVRKYFVEAGAAGTSTDYVAPVATRGVSFAGIANLCILCREICSDEQEMLDHFATVHVSLPTDKKKKYHCSCGETFFNSVLLKHHVFKLKEPHRILKEDEILKKASEDNLVVLLNGDDTAGVEEPTGEGLSAEEGDDHLITIADLNADGGQSTRNDSEICDRVKKGMIHMSDEDFCVNSEVAAAGTVYRSGSSPCNIGDEGAYGGDPLVMECD